ncbi:MAG: metalloregulator ArsR/SmtB family transcription factor [Anaerolineae bacterium]|nr:metalloregulator ArsR/SmtB family transcription factor [Anaerolineae bacterium]
MNTMDYEANLEARAELFKALGHSTRLLILNLIELKPRHGEELAAILALNPATISHHVAKLVAAGLLSSRKDQYYTVYSLNDEILERPISDVVFLPQPGLVAQVEEDAYRQKVLRTYFRHGRLTAIPTQRKKRLIILDKLIYEFEPGRLYTEREVNQVLVDFNEDVATLRRDLVDEGYLNRENSRYWRVKFIDEVDAGKPDGTEL